MMIEPSAVPGKSEPRIAKNALVASNGKSNRLYIDGVGFSSIPLRGIR